MSRDATLVFMKEEPSRRQQDEFSGVNSQAFFTNEFSETVNLSSTLLISNRDYFVSVEQIHS